MRIGSLAALTLALAAASPLSAQQPSFGAGFILGAPTGALSSTSYPDTASEKYNGGVGGQFTISWPVDRSLAMRLNLSAITFDGTGSAPQTYNWNVQDSMFSIGGEAEVFMAGGSAERHLGTYLIGGLHADFERFAASNYDPTYFAATTLNKTRLAATAGIGHTFRTYGRLRWTLEGAFHKTLTDTSSDDSAGIGFPASDYLKFYGGFTF